MSRRYENEGRDQIPIETFHGDMYVGEARSRQRPPREVTWLKAFEKEVEGRLATSLHNQILINLGKQAQPEQVHRLWDMEVKSGQITQTISPDTEILEVFDRIEIAGKLLILGKPGAGKTTTLLELARALVQKALDDPSEPMPFLLNLSSWKDPKLSIKDWAIAKLIGECSRSMPWAKWLENAKLLPLFDGLDEVRADLQSACVGAINRFISSETQLVPIIVCSRQEEYGLYPEKLNLNGAVYLNELTDERIKSYLGEVNRVDLWQMLGTDADWLGLARQPLLLRITLDAYRNELAQQWQALRSTEERIKFLLDAYIEQMLHKPLNSQLYDAKKKPTAKQTRSWLIFLAQQLERESQTEFLIEKMQPSWLVSIKQHKIYCWCEELMTGALVGLLSGIYYGWSIGATIALLTVLTSVIFPPSFVIRPVEILEWSSLKLKVFVRLSPIGFTFGAISAFIHAIIISTTGSLTFGIIVGLTATPVYSLIFLLCLGLFIGTVNPDVEINCLPNQGIFTSARNSVIAGSLSSLIFGIAFGLLNGLIFGLIDGITVGLKFGFLGGIFGLLMGGGVACIQHFFLRLVLFLNRAIPWDFARFLNYATERMLLQRIGGRYRFIHKLLQDHFAAMSEE